VTSDLAALACFVTVPWQTVSPEMPPENAGDILFFLGVRLFWTQRSSEALEALSSAFELQRKSGSSRCAHSARNLSEIHLARGELAKAMAFGEQAALAADKWSDPFVRAYAWAAWGYACLATGDRTTAQAKFSRARTTHQQSEDKLKSLGLY
jgi:tetratricopeptide (TPR) repeat protein